MKEHNIEKYSKETGTMKRKRENEDTTMEEMGTQEENDSLYQQSGFDGSD